MSCLMKTDPRRFCGYLAEPFQTGGRMDRLLVALFCAMHLVMLFNAFMHFPRINYDGGAHLKYVMVLSEGRLPEQGEGEFFSPPLPYALPALVHALGKTAGLPELHAVGIAGKVYQMQNWVCSLLLAFFLLKLAKDTWPDSRVPRRASLAILAMLPVYYKSFAFCRGEPMLATMIMISVYFAVHLFVRGRFHRRDVVGLMLTVAAATLSRQWGVFIYPAVGLYILVSLYWERTHRIHRLGYAMLIAAIAIPIGGSFYFSLQYRYGQMSAFNREASERFSFRNQPPEFYVGLGGGDFFRRPLAGSYANQMIPVFYTEFWGDYWGYWIFMGRDTRDTPDYYYQGPKVATAIMEASNRRPPWLETNHARVMPYMGRVNLVSLFPTVVLLAAVAMGVAALFRFAAGNLDLEVRIRSLLVLVVLCTLAGYFWFLVRFPNPGKGDTIKAVYVLQIFPLMAILAGAMLAALHRRHAILFWVVSGLLAATFIHNLPLLITRYPYLPV